MTDETTREGVSAEDELMNAINLDLGDLPDDEEPSEPTDEPVEQDEPADESPDDDASEPEPDDSDEGDGDVSTVDAFLEKTGLTREQFDALRDRIKVDGEDHELTIADLRKIQGLEKHVNNKSIKLSEQQKTWEAEQAKLRSEWQDRIRMSGMALDGQDQQLTQQYQQLKQQEAAVDWNGLYNEDPSQYAALQARYQQAYKQLEGQYAGIQQRKQQLAQHYQQTTQQQMEALRPKAREAINAAFPELADDAAYNNAMSDAKAYLKSIGADEKGTQALEYDPVVFRVARDAAAYHKLQQSREKVKPKVAKAPNIKGGARTTTSKGQAEYRKAKEALAKTGSADAFENLIFNSL